MARPGLTEQDWRVLYAVANREGGDLRAAVESVVRTRLDKAWNEGFDRGWTAGVDDAMGEHARPKPRPASPWKEET